MGPREAARFREVGGGEGGAEMKETEEPTGDRKMILEKLMDQDGEEPEVSKITISVLQILLLFDKIHM